MNKLKPLLILMVLALHPNLQLPQFIYNTAKDYYREVWQRENIKKLQSLEQDSRVFPHRVNSLEKLAEVWRDGFRSFEVDVIFGQKDPIRFRVGHHEGVMGSFLDEFLERVPSEKIERIGSTSKT